jgi:exodeoxyribonuclease VII large subunit
VDIKPMTTNAPACLSVSQLNQTVARLLERSFPLVAVQGEISNFTRASSGHWYFSLKDEQAQVRCAMFKGRAQWTDFVPRDGDRVELNAQVRLYEPRGDYQLIVDAIRRAGTGALLEAFHRLKEKLTQQGLLETERKRPLPFFVKTVGIITSPEAAALRDVVATLQTRAPYVRLILYPTSVQGAEAAKKIIQALTLANQRAEADVLILCRGGGSMEDLWCFNDEALAHAIAASALPVVTGVGHETDFTIADFVADLRAPTPTAAAQIVARPLQEWLGHLQVQQRHFVQIMQRKLDNASLRLDLAARGLISPTQRLDLYQQSLLQLQRRLQLGLHHRLAREEQGLQHLASLLTAFSPQQTLERGYVMVRRNEPCGQLVTQGAELEPGQTLSLQFHDRAVSARVT